MVLNTANICAFGWKARDFALKGVDGNIRSPTCEPKWYARLTTRRIWTIDSGDQTIVDITIVFSDEATRIRTSRCELRRPGPLA